MAGENKNASPDVSSPYFLHASDNPGQVYVSELLNETNYSEWVNDMTNALLAKNQIGFVDGTMQQPKADSADLSHWIRCDAMVKGWLKSGMDKEIRKSIRYAKTAREIWMDLSDRFGQGSAPRAYEIRRDIAYLRQNKQPVAVYYTKLKAFWDEARQRTPPPRCACGK